MIPKYLLDYKTKVKDDFFNEFLSTTETGYYIWTKHPEIKAGNWAGDIISFIWKCLDNHPNTKKRRYITQYKKSKATK